MALKQRPRITVAGYPAAVPDDRRAALQAVRAVANQHFPKGSVEATGFGMIIRIAPLKAHGEGARQAHSKKQ